MFPHLANTVGGTFNLADGNTPPVLFFLPRSVSDKGEYCNMVETVQYIRHALHL